MQRRADRNHCASKRSSWGACVEGGALENMIGKTQSAGCTRFLLRLASCSVWSSGYDDGKWTGQVCS